MFSMCPGMHDPLTGFVRGRAGSVSCSDVGQTSFCGDREWVFLGGAMLLIDPARSNRLGSHAARMLDHEYICGWKVIPVMIARAMSFWECCLDEGLRSLTREVIAKTMSS